jgi:hypothetical protein
MEYHPVFSRIHPFSPQKGFILRDELLLIGEVLKKIDDLFINRECGIVVLQAAAGVDAACVDSVLSNEILEGGKGTLLQGLKGTCLIQVFIKNFCHLVSFTTAPRRKAFTTEVFNRKNCCPELPVRAAAGTADRPVSRSSAGRRVYDSLPGLLIVIGSCCFFHLVYLAG